MSLRVLHCPVNTAGIPGRTRRRCAAAASSRDLLVFNRYKLHPEADISLERTGTSLRQQATQWRAFLKLLPRYDVFHFYSSVTLVPKSVQFRILHALGKKGVYQYLGSDIRGKTREQLAYGLAADAEIVSSYDAIRWVPEADVILPGVEVANIAPAIPSAEKKRPLIIHAPSSRRRKGTEHVIAAVDGLDADFRLVEGLTHDEAFELYREADIVVDQLNAGWYGVFAIECLALGKPVVTFLLDEAVRRTEEAYGVEVPRRLRDGGDAARAAAPARRGRRAAPPDRRRLARLRGAAARHRRDRRRARRALRAHSRLTRIWASFTKSP